MGRLEKEARDERVRKSKIISGTPFAQMSCQVYMVHAIKAPLVASVNTLMSPESSKIDKLKAFNELRKLLPKFSKLPIPTKENTWHPNSHHLIDIRDEFFKRCHLDNNRLWFINTLFNFAIILYDYDRPYRMMMDWCKEQLDRKKWAPRESQSVCGWDYSWWDEPGYE